MFDRRGLGSLVGSGIYFGRREGAGRGTPFYAEVGAYYSGPEGGWCASHPLVCSPGLSHSVFFVDVVRPVGHSFFSDDGLGGFGVTRRYPCPPIVSGRDTLKIFRKRAVSSMYRRFRQDFLPDHHEMLRRLLWRGCCCRR